MAELYLEQGHKDKAFKFIGLWWTSFRNTSKRDSAFRN